MPSQGTERPENAPRQCRLAYAFPSDNLVGCGSRLRRVSLGDVLIVLLLVYVAVLCVGAFRRRRTSERARAFLFWTGSFAAALLLGAVLLVVAMVL